MTTAASLCTGYLGLDLAAETVLGPLEHAWISEIDKDALTVLAERLPGVRNLGDLTRVDWSTVEPVDVLTAGYPCQPFSQAGKRKGEHDDRHLWPYIWRCR
jgi:DNA (cytosine-5)-methyltransferase 1